MRVRYYVVWDSFTKEFDDLNCALNYYSEKDQKGFDCYLLAKHSTLFNDHIQILQRNF